MSSQRRLLFHSSLTALATLRRRNGVERRPPARTSDASIRRPRIGNAMPMSVQLAPEPDPSAHVVELCQDQTTGPLPLGFEFELFGVRYTWFELSSDGFMTFGPTPSTRNFEPAESSRFIPLDAELKNFIALGLAETFPAGPRQVAYEVRGVPGRRRLVLSLTAAPGRPASGVVPSSVQVMLHERTGMIDVRFSRAA